MATFMRTNEHYTAGSMTLPQEAVDFWHETNLQDWHVCELGELRVSSQAYMPGWFTPLESLLAAFDRHYLTIMQA